ncbi:MAG: imidazoleglycerol-phosphate dehydratase HisB [Fidelibacterota bacterium]|nr:MAG: imidazoleglycerol-phosphate dehydratase HisB [Candidatus Neomarinimicrobiota bacterium]
MTSPKPIEIKRKTNETDIRLKLLLCGERKVQVETGIGFFDHLLQTLAFWAGWDLELSCTGDLRVDTHHTVEDVALALGQAFTKAREDAGNIERFGIAWMPMGETLSQVVVDLSGRPLCVFKADIGAERVGTFETVMTGHFFRSFAAESKVTLHVRTLYGEDPHHIIESMFKGLGLALRQALTPGTGGVASTKGAL